MPSLLKGGFGLQGKQPILLLIVSGTAADSFLPNGGDKSLRLGCGVQERHWEGGTVGATEVPTLSSSVAGYRQQGEGREEKGNHPGLQEAGT